MSTTKRVFAKLSAQEPMKVEFANLEQLKDDFLKRFKKHVQERDNVFARVRELAAEVGNLEREATALRNEINKISSSRQQAEKVFRDIGIDAPQNLDEIAGVRLGAYDNMISDTFETIDEIANKFK